MGGTQYQYMPMYDVLTRELPKSKYWHSARKTPTLMHMFFWGLNELCKLAALPVAICDRLTVPALVFVCAQSITANNLSDSFTKAPDVCPPYILCQSMQRPSPPFKDKLVMPPPNMLDNKGAKHVATGASEVLRLV